MPLSPSLERIEGALPGTPELETEALAEGFRFLAKLRAEWDSGANRFAKPGEIFLALRAGGAIVGLGGLNRDPYGEDARVGRLRHLYVARAHRGRGLGALLLAALREHGAAHFIRLRLRTDTEAAARFYERFGFRAARDPRATHEFSYRNEG